MNLPALSVVMPAYNEADNLPEVFTELRCALDPLGLSWEILVGDDGSTAGTRCVLDGLGACRPGLREVRRGAQRAVMIVSAGMMVTWRCDLSRSWV